MESSLYNPAVSGTKTLLISSECPLAVVENLSACVELMADCASRSLGNFKCFAEYLSERSGVRAGPEQIILEHKLAGSTKVLSKKKKKVAHGLSCIRAGIGLYP